MKIRGFDWDKGNRAKCQKHGVSIAEIEAVFLGGKAWITPDIKHSTIEDRFIAIRKVNARHVFVVFTERDEQVRPISARYMHQEEVMLYEEKIDS
jgi:uncharacterized DUF497 family protein